MNPESRGNSLTRKFRATVDSLHSHLSKGRIKFTIVLLVSIIVFFSVYHVSKSTSHSSTSYFTVVVDCGSTGSRVNVYKWFINDTNSKENPILLQSFPDQSNKSSDQGDGCQYHCRQTEPGLDKFVRNASGVREALEPLLLWAEKQIPSERHGYTSVFLLATAGLRKLPTQDSDWILETVESIVKTHPFVSRRNWIRVLSGQEEAYYGWVALNYKMGRLKSSIKVPTFGVLDMGGSSLQVVMETDKKREGHHTFRSKIGVVEYDILAYSLSAFGLNEAFDRTIVMLSEENPLMTNSDGRFQLRHPCLSSEVSRNYICHGCFHQNNTNLGNSSGQLLRSESSTLNLVGDPDWEKCKGIANAAAIHSSSTDWLQLVVDMSCKAHLSSSDSSTLRNLTVSPRRVVHFHALSGFFAVYNVLNLNPSANLTNILKRGQELCSRMWFDLKMIPGNEKYAGQFCFNVPYLASLIKDALCMADTEIIFGPGDVSWTLGAALVEGKPIWSSNSQAEDGTFTSKVISSPILFVILFLCLSFMLFLCQVTRTAMMPTTMPIKKVASVGVSMPSYIYPKRQSK
ncbi:hypothetical protein AQUCO_00200062v1 [Aquilegia coerulea]|uniref:Apyrase 7 n=1 Tax=Aquilegia coerulea TaxID=218851 RepID=A0A2G5F1N8_AQUCA|nr:hypothetical protein AQUCO_00200062v1 [Aquilegia coerulea]